MRHRHPLNGLMPRTLRELDADPHDWLSGRYVSNKFRHRVMRMLGDLWQWLCGPSPWK